MLDDPKMKPAPKAPRENYHHGDLRGALIRAADAILAESGVEGFTLRAAARRAGVSPAAPAYHFSSVRGLLTEVAILGYEELQRHIEIDGFAGDDTALLRRQAAGYVRFALTYPGRFRVMFRPDLHLVEDERLHQAAYAAMGQLAATVCRRAQLPLSPRPEPRAVVAVLAAWSQAHGIAQLFLDGKLNGFAGATTPQEAADRLLDDVLAEAWPERGHK